MLVAERALSSEWSREYWGISEGNKIFQVID